MSQEKIGCLILLGFLLLLGGCSAVFQLATQETIEGVVVDDYVKRVGEKDRFFIVIKTDDGEDHVLMNKDSIWWRKWNSADVQQDLDEDVRYSVTTTGLRWGPMSWFPNIVEYEMLPTSDDEGGG